jgi:integrase/recombinase XerD
MSTVRWERYPHVAQFPTACAWLRIQTNLGLAQNTVDAYARALEDYTRFCERELLSVETATKASVSLYIHDLTSRPNPRGNNIRALNSGFGLANATLQQRLVAIRLFHDYLVEEGIRADNPIGRGHYTSGKSFGGMRNKKASSHTFISFPGFPTRINGNVYCRQRE